MRLNSTRCLPKSCLTLYYAVAWEGKYQVAMELADRAAELDPTFFFTPFMKGWIHLETGNVTAAIPELQRRRDRIPSMGCRLARVCLWGVGRPCRSHGGHRRNES